MIGQVAVSTEWTVRGVGIGIVMVASGIGFAVLLGIAFWIGSVAPENIHIGPLFADEDGRPTILFVLVWIAFPGWMAYKGLRYPRRIQWDANSPVIRFSAPLREVCVFVRSIRTLNARPQYLVLQHDNGTVDLERWYHGFEHFMERLSVENPAISFEGEFADWAAPSNQQFDRR